MSSNESDKLVLIHKFKSKTNTNFITLQGYIGSSGNSAGSSNPADWITIGY